MAENFIDKLSLAQKRFFAMIIIIGAGDPSGLMGYLDDVIFLLTAWRVATKYLWRN
jgi:hypothetical protein